MRKTRKHKSGQRRLKCRGRAVSRRRLGIQTLESRRLMAGDIGLVDGYLAVTGTELNDAVEVFADADQIVVSTAQYGEDGAIMTTSRQSFERDGIRGIYLDGGSGDDVLVNDTDLPAIISGGVGDDVLVGGSSRDVLHGGPGNDVLLGEHDTLLGGGGDNVLIMAAQSEEEVPDVVGDTPIEDAVANDTVAEKLVVEDPVTEGLAIDAIEQDAPAVEVVGDNERVNPFAMTFTSSVTVMTDREGVWDAPSVVTTMVALVAPTTERPETLMGPIALEQFTPFACCPAVEELPAVAAVESVVEDAEPASELDAPLPEISRESEALDTRQNLLADTTLQAADEQAAENDDILIGGAGRDLVIGGEGNDLVFGDQIDDDLLADLVAAWSNVERSSVS